MSSYAVVIDCGSFDHPVFDSESEIISQNYLDVIQPHCTIPLVIKPKEEVRRLIKQFRSEDVLVSVSIETEKKGI